MTDNPYQVTLSSDWEDPLWDDFLVSTPGGHHVQTSLWAQVKCSIGWRCARTVVTQGTQIVGGAQMLIRPFPVGGSVAYVSKAPLLRTNDSQLADLIVDSLVNQARQQRVQCLVVQPAVNYRGLTGAMARHGFLPTTIQVAPAATIIIDLKPGLQEILAGMKAHTRRNVRLSKRRGVTVREGHEEDLATYYQLLLTTSQRKGFDVFPEAYYRQMWVVLGSRGYLKLLIAEYGGEVVSAMLVIPFGDTLLNKLSVWSGQHGQAKPNEALQWAAIQWAKSHGYRYYDLEGIEPKVAKQLVGQGTIEVDGTDHPLTKFKLGFGGRVTLFPPAGAYVANPILRQAAPLVLSRMSERSIVKQALSYLRTTDRWRPAQKDL